MRAAAGGDGAGVRAALDAGADVNVTDERGMTALMLAAWRGSEDVAREVLGRGPDFTPRATDGWRALTYAAANTFPRPDGTRTQILRMLFDAGDRLEPGDGDWRAVHYAAEWGNTENVALLLEHGMDPDVRDPDGMTPLMRAARKSKAEIVRLLLDRGADPNAQDRAGTTALMCAARRANLDQVRGLLDAGAKTDLTDAEGQTALDIARAAKRSKIATLLA